MSFADNLAAFVNTFRYDGCQVRFLLWRRIAFQPPAFQTDQLHAETACKFDRISSIPLPKGAFGPFYRYVPGNAPLKADNDVGGYFTDEKLTCAGCAKVGLWLFDKRRRYFYEGTTSLYLQECYFLIKDPGHATIFVGAAAYGGLFQIRPNNWVLGGPAGNKVVYSPRGKLATDVCNRCRPFLEAFTPIDGAQNGG